MGKWIGGRYYKGTWRNFSGDGYAYYFDHGDGFTGEHTYKIDQIVHFTDMQITVRQLYLNKAFFKKWFSDSKLIFDLQIVQNVLPKTPLKYTLYRSQQKLNLTVKHWQ